MTTPTVVMTIGGSDSGAGAGAQADLKTLSAHGVYATTVITAVTAQNTRVVERVQPVDLDVVRAQIHALLTDLPPAAVKTGLLGRAEVVRLVAETARDLPNLVVDPVLANRRGEVLVDEAAIEAYRSALVPAAVISTPSHREASLLTDLPIRDLDEQRTAAEALARTTGTTVVVTGGRLGAHQPIDIISDGFETTELTGRWVRSRNVHGTGDAFSASIAARLAAGTGLLVAISEAKAWVARAIAGSADWRLGHGEGPLDHFGWA